MLNSDKLLSCPFCGTTPTILSNHTVHAIVHKCKVIQVFIEHHNLEELSGIWNKRIEQNTDGSIVLNAACRDELFSLLDALNLRTVTDSLLASSTSNFFRKISQEIRSLLGPEQKENTSIS